MILSQRQWIVLLSIAVAFCAALLAEPDWDLKEARLLRVGQPTKVFDSMNECSMNLTPGDLCARPLNPGVIVYWLVFLAGVGVAAGLLLRTRLLPSAILLFGAMTLGGACGFVLLSRQPLFEPEAWALAPFVVAVHASISVVAFGLARLVRQFIAKRRSAT